MMPIIPVNIIVKKIEADTTKETTYYAQYVQAFFENRAANNPSDTIMVAGKHISVTLDIALKAVNILNQRDDYPHLKAKVLAAAQHYVNSAKHIATKARDYALILALGDADVIKNYGITLFNDYLDSEDYVTLNQHPFFSHIKAVQQPRQLIEQIRTAVVTHVLAMTDISAIEKNETLLLDLCGDYLKEESLETVYGHLDSLRMRQLEEIVAKSLEGSESALNDFLLGSEKVIKGNHELVFPYSNQGRERLHAALSQFTSKQHETWAQRQPALIRYFISKERLSEETLQNYYTQQLLYMLQHADYAEQFINIDYNNDVSYYFKADIFQFIDEYTFK